MNTYNICSHCLTGFIPKGTNIEALQEKVKEFGAGCLRKIYTTASPADKVTKIIFTQSCRNVIPENLISCLKNVLKITDPKTLKRKCEFVSYI